MNRFVQPILQRLRQIDGRASVTFMLPSLDPADERVHELVAQGFAVGCRPGVSKSLQRRGDLRFAAHDYFGCLDSLAQFGPVCFQMPHSETANTVGPRFYSELFNRQSPQWNWLSISSSVFNLPTSHDNELPRSLVIDGDGNERFAKYIRGFARPEYAMQHLNWVENYPYPYVVGHLCWEFP